MDSCVERRLWLVWLGLSVITLLQLWLGTQDSREMISPDALITLSVIGMALVKVRFIVMEFMEVRHAPVLLRRLTDGWIAFTALALTGVYLAGRLLNQGI